MRPLLARSAALLLAAACAGCASGGTSAALGLGAAAAYVLDPLGPNWRVAETRVAPRRFRITLRERRFAIGGDGEAEALFERSAASLARARHASGYTVLAYTEGIDSTFPVAQRVARGEIRLDR